MIRIGQLKLQPNHTEHDLVDKIAVRKVERERYIQQIVAEVSKHIEMMFSMISSCYLLRIPSMLISTFFIVVFCYERNGFNLQK